MATGTFMDADKVTEITNALVSGGSIDGSNHIILTTPDSSTIDIGTLDLSLLAPKATPTFTGKATFVSTVHTPVAVSLSSGHAAIDANAGDNFKVNGNANMTIDAPSNASDGQNIHIRITQDATGSRTVTWNAIYDFGTAGTPTATTTANKVDVFGFEYNAALTKWMYLGSGLGF